MSGFAMVLGYDFAGVSKIDFERIDKIDSAWADEPILRGFIAVRCSDMLAFLIID